MLSTRYNGKLIQIVPLLSGGYFWIVQSGQSQCYAIERVGSESFASLALMAAFTYVGTLESAT